MTNADVPRVAVDNPIPASWERQVEANARRAAEPGPAISAQQDDRHADVPESRAAEAIERRGRDKVSRRFCEGCGHEVKDGNAPHMVFSRVVRPNNRYGQTAAGEIVWVEMQDLALASEATMSLDEFRATIRAASNRPAPPPPTLKSMVERSLQATIEQTKRMIQDGRTRAELDEQRAAAEAASLRRQATASDAEPASQPTVAMTER